MGEAAFRVIFSSVAWSDLDELTNYWDKCGAAWRAEKYHRALIHQAEIGLSDSAKAHRGRSCKSRHHPAAREILAFGIYPIIYEIDEPAQRVNVLRFWHAHRAEPRADA